MEAPEGREDRDGIDEERGSDEPLEARLVSSENELRAQDSDAGDLHRTIRFRSPPACVSYGSADENMEFNRSRRNITID